MLRHASYGPQVGLWSRVPLHTAPNGVETKGGHTHDGGGVAMWRSRASRVVRGAVVTVSVTVCAAVCDGSSRVVRGAEARRPPRLVVFFRCARAAARPPRSLKPVAATNASVCLLARAQAVAGRVQASPRLFRTRWRHESVDNPQKVCDGL